jgi:integrase
MGLTVKGILHLTKPGTYADRDGLYLQVLSATNRSWLFRYTLRGKSRWMGLGPLREVTLDQARAEAFKAKQQRRAGIDPINARQSAQQSVALAELKTKTFAECAEGFFNTHAGDWSAKARNGYQQTLQDYVLPTLGKLPVAAVDTALVMQCMEPIWQAKSATANNVRRRIEGIWNWGKSKGYCAGENPARWVGHLQHQLKASKKTTKHHAAMPYLAVGQFMVDLWALEGIPAKALEFTVLSACRTNEVIAARWAEIDLENKVWTIPADRMKARKEHRVPLCPRMVALLQSLPRLNDYVFPAGKQSANHVSHNAMQRLMRAMGREETVHGFRSTFRDYAAEMTGYPNEVAEMVLAHVIKSKVEAAYRRGDLYIKRTRLMADWADWCASPHTGGTVVPMRKVG